MLPIKSEKFCQTISVSSILNDTKFYGLPKLIPKLSILPLLLIILIGFLNIYFPSKGRRLSNSGKEHHTKNELELQKQYISLKFLPVLAFSSDSSGSSSAIRRIMSSALRMSFFFIVFRLLCCWSISRDTLSGNVSESTRPCKNQTRQYDLSLETHWSKHRCTYVVRIQIKGTW